MQKSKLFFLILFLFVVALTGALYWFENQEASPENNQYIALPDSLIQQLAKHDSTEKANFLNAAPPKMEGVITKEMFFEQKKDAYTFQLFRDSLGVKLIVLFGTKTVAENRDKALENSTKAETSDLNSDGFPEILIYSKINNKLTFTGFEVQNGLHKFSLPALMGRQSFGYAGQDTLFVENNNLVRRFQFRNSQFSAFPSGTRTCEYALGHDLKFSMVRTLDTE